MSDWGLSHLPYEHGAVLACQPDGTRKGKDCDNGCDQCAPRSVGDDIAQRPQNALMHGKDEHGAFGNELNVAVAYLK